MRQETAETIAIQALGWLAGDDALFETFLGASGISAAEVRARAAEPEFQASVLDFVLMNDDWVIGFCDAAGLAYEAPGQARMALPGGAQVHWT